MSAPKLPYLRYSQSPNDLPRNRYNRYPQPSYPQPSYLDTSPESSWVLIKVRREEILHGMQDGEDVLTLRGQTAVTSNADDRSDEYDYEKYEEALRVPSPTYHRDPSNTRSRPRYDSDPTTNYDTSQEYTDLERADANEKKGQIFEDDDSALVTWDGPDDPDNPKNWPKSKKWRVTITMGLMTFIVTFASSVYSTGVVEIAHEFHVSTLVATLGLAVYVCGFAVGPVLWGPGSELYGRKPPLFVGYFCFVIMQIPVAVAQNLQTIMLCRFFGGMFGSAPLAIVAGAFVDFWDSADLTVAVMIFAGATFVGPVGGPIVGSFVVKSYLGWRWTMWLSLIAGAFFGLLGFICIPETYGPIILKNRAQRLRLETRNWALHAKKEEENVELTQILHKYLLKPFAMLAFEPILLLLTIYLSLIYGILYLFFEAYPISFQVKRKWLPGVASLPFLSIGGGVMLSGVIIIWYEMRMVPKKCKERGVAKLPPEDKLILMMIGSFMLPAGLFWFAWTSNPAIIWVPQLISGIPLGCGILMIFMQGINYIIDVYGPNAASAVSANTILRSLAGGGFPMFAPAMYANEGVQWATSILGFLCVAMIPAPIAFYFYGETLRKMSRYSPYS